MSSVLGGNEHWSVAAEGRQILPQASRQYDGMGFGAFAEDRDLPGVAIGLQMPPFESTDFGDSPARRIEKTQKHVVSAGRRESDHSLDLRFGQDSFRKRVHWFRRPNGCGDRKSQVADPECKA